MGRDVGVSREGNDRDIARAGELAHRSDGERKQRPENDLRAFIKRLLRRLLRAGSSAPVVLDDELNIRAVEFRKCHLGGVAHGLRSHSGVPGRRERQDETGLDLAGADIGRRLRRSAGGRARQQVLDGKVAGAAGCQQRRSDDGGNAAQYPRQTKPWNLQYSVH